MSGEDIASIIISLGLTAWIPIYFLFGGIAKVVNAIKGNPNEKNKIEEQQSNENDTEFKNENNMKG